jgi:tRNA-dihydrouridine synthase
MGCPVPKVVKLGACSALINHPKLAIEIIKATQEGVDGKLPISVKTRPGFLKVDSKWTQILLNQKLDCLTIHGRTSKQLSKVPNNWDLIERVREQRDEIAPDTIIIGNGDVITRQQGLELAKKYKLDGIMIGRGVFKDPYVFSNKSKWDKTNKSDKLELFIKHINLFEKTWEKQKNPAILKKFTKIYVNGFDGASELRALVMATNSIEEMIEVLGLAK